MGGLLNVRLFKGDDLPIPHGIRHKAGALTRNSPAVRDQFLAIESVLKCALHSAATVLPGIIRPAPHRMMIAITGSCNARCIGCRYERDFMVGEQLSYETVEGVLEDAADAGVRMVRFYGGEPLLHRDLPAMVERAVALGMNPYVTTNAALLDQRIDRLVAAG